MDALNTHQIGIILTNRLSGLEVYCTTKKQDIISLIIRDRNSQAAYEVTGIRLSHYRGKHGANALAHQLLEGITASRSRLGRKHKVSITSPVFYSQPDTQNMRSTATLTLAANSRRDSIPE